MHVNIQYTRLSNEERALSPSNFRRTHEGVVERVEEKDKPLALGGIVGEGNLGKLVVEDSLGAELRCLFPRQRNAGGGGVARQEGLRRSGGQGQREERKKERSHLCRVDCFCVRDGRVSVC